jgi:hypothetical protein
MVVLGFGPILQMKMVLQFQAGLEQESAAATYRDTRRRWAELGFDV